MNENSPFFSVLIPSYNRPETLKRSIDSILDQDFESFEIIVSDDNSPRQDEIKAVALLYESNNNVKFYFQKNNLKEPENKNFLVRKSNAKYNIILGDDDFLLPSSLSKIFYTIEKNPRTDIFGLGYCTVNNAGELAKLRRSARSFTINSDRAVKTSIICGGLPLLAFHPATFCCKSGIEIALPYASDVGIGEDLYFLIRVLLEGRVITTVPEICFAWRKVEKREADNQTNQSADQVKCLEARVQIYYKILNQSKHNRKMFRFIDSCWFRKRFIYLEAIDNNLVIKCSNLLKDETHSEEIISLNKSWFFRYTQVRFRKIYIFIDAAVVIGIFNFVWTYISNLSRRKKLMRAFKQARM